MGHREAEMGAKSRSTATQRIPKPTGRLLTIKQASKYLGLTVWAIRERIWSGQIPAVRFPGGRKLYLDREDLDRFIDQSKFRYQ